MKGTIMADAVSAQVEITVCPGIDITEAVPYLEEVHASEVLGVLAVVVLLSAVPALYIVAAHRKGPAPQKVWCISAWLLGVVYLLAWGVVASWLIRGLNAFAKWTGRAGEEFVVTDWSGPLTTIGLLLVLAFHALAAVRLAWRPRLLLGWTGGALVGFAIWYFFIADGFFKAASQCEQGIQAWLVTTHYGLTLLVMMGPAAALPFAWSWRRRAIEGTAH